MHIGCSPTHLVLDCRPCRTEHFDECAKKFASDRKIISAKWLCVHHGPDAALPASDGSIGRNRTSILLGHLAFDALTSDWPAGLLTTASEQLIAD